MGFCADGKALCSSLNTIDAHFFAGNVEIHLKHTQLGCTSLLAFLTYDHSVVYCEEVGDTPGGQYMEGECATKHND